MCIRDRYDVAHLENAYEINMKQNQADVKSQIMKHGAAGVMYYHDDLNMGWNDTLQCYTCLLYTSRCV